MSSPLLRALSLSDSTTPESVAPSVCDSCSTELEKELPSTLAPFQNPKDVRAYEHNRRQVKKAAERALTKARKQRGWAMCKGAVYDKTKCSCCQSDKGKRLGSKDAKVLLDSDTAANVVFPDTARHRRTDSLPTQSSLPFKGATRDVKLTDLITAVKPKKSKEGDFEVVPHIRSVIVLDDFSEDERDAEEPWEHVEGDEFDEKTNGPSYAEIAAVAK